MKTYEPEDVRMFVDGQEVTPVSVTELIVKPKISYEAFDTYPVQEIPIKVKKVDRLATIPQYAHEGDAGFDLCSVDAVELQPGETKVISTGLKMAIPRGYEVQVRPRSGMSLKTSLRITNSPGTIDSPYRGVVGIILQNTGKKTLHIDIGDRVAQGILNRVPQAAFVEVEDLDETTRGEGGFGHTGR